VSGHVKRDLAVIFHRHRFGAVVMEWLAMAGCRRPVVGGEFRQIPIQLLLKK